MTNHISDTHLEVLEKQTIACEDIEALWGDRVEDEIPVTLKARLDAHVKCCEHCQNFDRSYRHVISLASDLRDQPMPKEVQNRLRQKLNEKLGLSLALVG